MKKFTFIWPGILALLILFVSAVVYAVDPTGFRDVYISNSEHIGGTGLANTKSLLELTSTSKGMLPPRMTTTQQNAISSPPEGLLLYDSTLHIPAYYNGSAWFDINDITSMTGILGVSHGGTGLASGTSGGVLAFTASGTIASSGALTANQVVIGGGAGVVPSTLAAGSQYQSLVMGAANPAWSAVSLAQAAATTGQLLASRGGTGQDFSASSGAMSVSSGTFSAGTLSVGNGGTGIASGTSGGIPYYSGSTTIASSGILTQHALVLGGGAGNAPTVDASLGTSTTLLHGAAAGDPTWSAVSMVNDVTGTLAVGNGGTGQTSAASAFVSFFETVATTANDIVYGGTSGTPTRLAGNISATKNFLASSGNGSVSTAFAWSTIVASDVPSLDASKITSGTLAVAQGGTNLASGTSGGILGYTASGTLASSVALTAHAIVLGGGAGATPTVDASLGTSTTLLHGAAAGDPTWSAVSMANDVTGTLAVGNGGTGQTSYTDGQLLIGNTTGNTLAKATITAGTGITVTNGSGAITIASTGAAAAALNYRGLSGTATAVAGDYIVASGASWTLTLPTAVGVSGQTITVEHGGAADMSQKYSLATTSSQTVGNNCATTTRGSTCTSGNYTLTTLGEVVVLVSDNANWQVMQHHTATPAVAYTPTISNGWTVTGGTTKFTWQRNGSMMHVLGSFTTSASAANIGSVSLPANSIIDTTGQLANTTAAAGPIVGFFHNGAGNSAGGAAVLALGTSSTLVYNANPTTANTTTTPQTGSAGNCGIITGVCSVMFDVPISDWQP